MYRLLLSCTHVQSVVKLYVQSVLKLYVQSVVKLYVQSVAKCNSCHGIVK